MARKNSKRGTKRHGSGSRNTRPGRKVKGGARPRKVLPITRPVKSSIGAYREVFRKVLLREEKFKEKGFVEALHKKGIIRFNKKGQIVAGRKFNKAAILGKKSLRRTAVLVNVEVKWVDKKGKKRRALKLDRFNQIVSHKGMTSKKFFGEKLPFRVFDIVKNTLSEGSLDWAMSPVLKFLKEKKKKRRDLPRDVKVSVEIVGEKYMEARPIKRTKKKRGK